MWLCVFGVAARSVTHDLVNSSRSFHTDWADARMTDDATFCSAARLYLKAALLDGGPADVVLSGDDEPVVAKFGCGLLETFLVDEGDRFTFVQHRHLRAVGWTPGQLRETAIRNLEKFYEGRLRIHQAGPTWALILDGNFEASLLALDDLWDSVLREYAPRGPVAAVPCRDVLAFCDVDSSEGIAELHRVIERVEPDRYPIASQPLRRLAGRWVPFVADR
jgi:hypothetical protein